MDVKECTKAFDLLIKDGYSVDKIEYCEESFGDFAIYLSNKQTFGIKFLRDRGIIWCELFIKNEWVLMEDVYKVLNILFQNNHTENIYENLRQYSESLTKHKIQIEDAFVGKNTAQNIKLIEIIREERVNNLLKKYK